MQRGHGGNPQDRAASLEQVHATILYYLHNKEEVSTYLADWLEFCRQQREEQKQNPSSARQRFRQLKAEAALGRVINPSRVGSA